MAKKQGKDARNKPKEKRSVLQGVVHIQSTFNNTIVSITDPKGEVISWASAGTVGFKGTKKGTPFAAQMAAENAARKSLEHGLKRVDVYVKGPGFGPRDGDPLAADMRAGGEPDQGRHPHSPQRLPAAEAAASLEGGG